jgi:heme iron utilization protein
VTPEDAEAARQLVRAATTATLSTLSAPSNGSAPYPFGSLVATATDARGIPLLLLSSLAEHSKNLAACPRASLLFTQPDAAEPLASPRVTLLGEVAPVRGQDVPRVRDAYLARHPNASAWASFKDFAFYEMTIAEVRLVAGFGKMGWIDVADYLRS